MDRDQAVDQKRPRRSGVTLQDVAVRAGTSASVASAVLNRSKSKSIRVGKETEEAVLKAAAEMGYRRNPIAQGLATGKTKVVGLMLGVADNKLGPDPYYSVIISGVSREAARHDYSILLLPEADEDDPDYAARHVDRRLDGVIVTAPRRDSAVVMECRRQGLPCCAISPFPDDEGLVVRLDDEEAALTAVRHLISLGHRRIAHLFGPAHIGTSAPRQRGWRQALEEAGLDGEGLALCANFNRKDGRKTMASLLALPKDRRPTAVFAANDLCAHGALDAIKEAGLSCPRDAAVVGCDDTWYATLTHPALSTIDSSVFQMGEAAASALIGLLEGRSDAPSRVVFPPRLVVRESCGGHA